MVTAENVVRRFGMAVTSVGTRMTTFARAAIGIGAALSIAFIPAIKVAADFERQMDAVQAIVEQASDSAGNSVEDFKNLQTTVRQLGQDTRFTAVQVAQASTFLVRAGFSAKEAAAGLSATLSLAAIGTMDLARAAEISADVMRAFRLEAQSLGRVVDVLAVTATNANTQVGQLGFALSFASPTAAALGASLEEVTAVLGVLANAGIKGTTAGTSLSRIMDSLARGTTRTTKVLGRYGLTLADVDPKANSLVDILQKLEAVSLSAGDAMQIFGVRGGRSFLALMNQGSEKVAEFTAKNEAAALAAQLMMETMEDNLTGTLLKLKSALQDLIITLIGDIKETDSFAAALAKLGQEVRLNIVDFKAWVEANQPMVNSILKIGGAITAASVALGAIALPTGMFLQILGPLVTMLGTLGSVLLSVGGTIVSAFMGPWLAVIAVIALIALPVFNAVVKMWERIKATAMNVFNAIKAVIMGTWAGIKSGYDAFLKPAFAELQVALEWLIGTILQMFDSLSETGPMFGQLGGAIGQVLMFVLMLITKLITAVTWFLVGLNAVTLGIMKFGVGALKWFGLIKEAAEEDTQAIQDAADALAAAQAAQNASNTAYVADQKLRAKANGERIASAQKLLDLANLGKTLGAQQLRELADLKKAHADVGAELAAGLTEAEHNLALTEQEIVKTQALGQSVRELEAIRRTNRAEVDMATKALELHTKVMDENQETLQRTWQMDLKLAKMMDARAEAQRTLADTDKEMAKVREELQKKELDGLAGELAEIKGVRGQQIAMSERRIAALKTEIEFLNAIKPLEESAAKAKERLEAVNRRLSQLKDEENLKRQIEIAQRNELNALIKEEHKKREELIRDARIDDAKLRGDKLRGAQLEAQKLLKVEEEKNQEILAAAKASGKKELAHAQRIVGEKRAIDRRRAQDIMRKAEDEVFGAKGKVIGAAEREVKIEESVTKQLTGQVRSLQDMLMLYQAIAFVRDTQERRAFAAARDTIIQEEKVARLRARAFKNLNEGKPDDVRLRQEIKIEEARLRLMKGVAAKRAGEAGLEGEAARELGLAANGAGQAVGEMERNMAAARTKFKVLVEAIGADFEIAGQTWMMRLAAGIRLGIPQVLNAIQDMLDQATLLVGMAADGFGGGPRLDAAMPGGPDVNGFANAAAVIDPAPGIGGDFNDNRQVNMDVNNNVDIDDVTRVVGEGIGEAFNNGTGV